MKAIFRHSAAGGRGGVGAGDRALARGRKTNIHAIIDEEGSPIAFEIKPRNWVMFAALWRFWHLYRLHIVA